MALTKCPDCGKDVSSAALTCPTCGRPIASSCGVLQPDRLPAKKKSSPLVTGCLVVVIVFIGLWAIGVLMSSGPSYHRVQHTASGVPFVQKTGPDGRSYFGMPPYQVGDNTKVMPVVRIGQLLKSSEQNITAELKKQMGNEVVVTYSGEDESYTATPQSPFKGVQKIVVGFYQGKVLVADVWFDPPVQDWAVALALVDLEPRKTPPTLDAIGAARWDYLFSGLDEVVAAHEPEGSPAIREVYATVSKALLKEAQDEDFKAWQRKRGGN